MRSLYQRESRVTKTNNNSVVIKDLDKSHNNLFMWNSIIKDDFPSDKELLCPLDHLSPCDQLKFREIKEDYILIFTTTKHQIGKFTGFSAQANIDHTKNCKQHCRSRVMPEAAWTDLNKYKDSGVFAIADEGTDHWIANITLTKRPTVQ